MVLLKPFCPNVTVIQVAGKILLNCVYNQINRDSTLEEH